ncbi:MAG: hypothetical protein A2086_09015 [Spirochaetes bacterium GWD1_27_9]|nr:MAG: hypothetical protein A2Z98_05630 [Spirochaetes bacterium GWB1_27_13]OHD26725.1 MAG: hypothetical protein A2Y34_10115 [Spirochaetes bacterium GWC1_27_15]OHD44679.1 MAG: hypothetical protein A2086_09015 [Spirochaetes bacterium GWD1_27_9]
MDILIWQEAYNVGIEKFDKQHKQLVSYINVLYNAINSNEKQKVVGELIAKLIEYSETHFLEEEDLLKKIEYPEYSDHKIVHKKFIKTVRDFQDRYVKGDSLVCKDLLYFLQRWLIKHILEEDKKYSSYF